MRTAGAFTVAVALLAASPPVPAGVTTTISPPCTDARCMLDAGLRSSARAGKFRRTSLGSSVRRRGSSLRPRPARRRR